MFHIRVFLVATVLCCVSALTRAAVPNYVSAAIADKHRPDAEVSRDVNRHPGELIQFAGIKPGMTVVDLLPGIGSAAYFTRIFSGVVGPKGKVYAYFGTQYDTRLKERGIDPDNQGRTFSDYPNVTALHTPLVQFKTPEAVDLIWTSDNYHDMHNKSYDTNVSQVNAAIFTALKPGGIYLVVDHRAQKGAGTAVTETLHRMDEDLAKKEIEAAGFKLVGESDLLQNPSDDDSKRVFEEGEHDHTDQFILKFQKPR
jgi:predicted methyltransferase